jgi:8-oxo-dGTP pyrophosphatase MutT (NUDIX family)
LPASRFDDHYLTAEFVEARLRKVTWLEEEAERHRRTMAAGPTALGVVAPTDGTGVRADPRLALGLLGEAPMTPAAVLVPIVLRAEGLTILLTKRTSHLAKHAGQVAFPGGRLEPEDHDAVAGALRETWEEVGLAADHIRIIGRLDTYMTGSMYSITPVVGLVTPPFTLKPDPEEVAEIFEMPLGAVVDAANHLREEGDFEGQRYEYYVLPHKEHYIWGVTAAMLVNLSELLAPDP